MPTHKHSTDALRQHAPHLGLRDRNIYAYLELAYPAAKTDRELKDIMGYEDMNCVRPSVTRLIENGRLIEVDSVIDDKTGCRVRRCRAATEAEHDAWLRKRAMFRQQDTGSACSSSDVGGFADGD